MHHFIYPSKDTFITNQPNLMLKNSGLDEILEVECTIQPKSCTGTSGSVVSRTLIQFDLTELSESVSSGVVTSPKYFLTMRCSEASRIPIGYSLVAYPVATDWTMGTGYKFDGSLTADGASWKFSDGRSSKWYVSSSLIDCSGGGTWFSNSGSVSSGSIGLSGSLMCSQSFNYQTSDVRMDVSSIVNSWLSGSIPNFGILLAHSGESTGLDYGKLRFFSKETNTIYQPYLDVAWDESTFNTGSGIGTGSLNPVNINDAIIGFPKLAREYKSGNTIRIDVLGRKKYPLKTFTNKLSDYIEPMYLPSSSYYSIRDAETEVVVVPYDDFSKLSCDSSGNYFYLDTSGLPQERYYKIEIRCEQNGSVVTFPSALSFKISR